ncbi:kinase-like domain-containing protein [Desarmillaria ectypa]|nr:kinase-like domain-containing protein [Desarmillaria ectypa]
MFKPNEHISVGPDGKVYADLTFVEEPLALPAQEGYGWPQLEFNEAIGPENRYVISRKLGWGMSSSTWLARDKVDRSYVAIKVLSGYYTDLVERGRVWELGALEKVLSPPSRQHLCLITKVLGGDVKSLFAKRGIFPFPLAKRIVLHLLRGIAYAHSRGVLHTDLKHDNIFFDTPMSTDDFDELLVSDPPRRHPSEPSHDGLVKAAVLQPLPIPTLQEAMRLTFVVADFGSAQPIDIHTQDEISPLPLRPPEIMIGGPWDDKADIWTFGCLVHVLLFYPPSPLVDEHISGIFELITGRALFKYEPFPKHNLDEPNYILYQIICYTGEAFGSQQLSDSPLAGKFFDSTCNLRANPPLIDYLFEISIRRLKVIEEADVLSTAALMRRCLRLDPAQRASAAELLSDPWFNGLSRGEAAQRIARFNVAPIAGLPYAAERVFNMSERV